MNETEEKRVCQKCGKRLPSSNNFCMYCGCNDEELESLKDINASNIHTQNKQELLNKSINAKDRELVISNGKSDAVDTNEEDEKIRHINKKNSLKNNLIYVFILLDVILISTVLLIKSDGLLYEKFKYDLENYDRVINFNNTDFIVLDNNKIKVFGENISKNDDTALKKLSKYEILDIRRTSPSENVLLAETKDTLYILSSTSIVM